MARNLRERPTGHCDAVNAKCFREISYTTVFNQNQMPNFRHKLREVLGQDPSDFLTSYCVRSDTDYLQHLVKQSLALIEESELKHQKRKKLSRQIGIARRSGRPTDSIIDNVASVTRELDELDASVSENITRLTQRLQPNATEPELAAPLHFLLDESVSERPTEPPLIIACESPFPAQEWQTYVESHKKSTAYHDARWHGLLAETFDHQPHYIIARVAGKVVGVLPVIHMKSRLFGSSLVSLPYLNYSGVLADTPLITEQILDYASGLLQTIGASHLELRDTVARRAPVTKCHKVSMILKLPESDQQLDNALGTKLRAQVKRAQQHGLTLKHGGSELLDSFYYVFSHNMRDLGTPVYSRNVFRRIVDTFPDKASITVVYNDEKPLAAGFLIGHNDKMEIPWASSIRQSNHLGANMYLYRAILKKTIQSGYQFFDFGRSSIGASTHKFKRQWGATEHQLYWHYWSQNKCDIPEVNPQNPKYQMAIKVWKNLPLPIANTIGPFLSKDIP